MANESAKVLVIASGEDSRDATSTSGLPGGPRRHLAGYSDLRSALLIAYYVVVTGLKENGHDPLICCSPDAETRIKPDFPLEKGTSLGGISGIIILDDGGDPKSCAALAKRADDEDLMVAGIGQGCLLMSSIGILKDHYVCDGLPDKAYEEDGVIKVDSPSVRSNSVITCSDYRMSEGFLALVIDALGGKARRIVTGKDEPVAEASLLIIDEPSRWPDYWRIAMTFSGLGRRTFIGRWEDVDVPNGTATCLALDADGVRGCRTAGIPKSIWFRQEMPLSVAAKAVSDLEAIGCGNVNSSESMRLAAGPLSEVIGGIVDVDESGGGMTVMANRLSDGWRAEASGPVKAAVESACTAFQAALSNPDGVNSVSVRVTLRDDRPTINGIDPLASDVDREQPSDDPRVLRAVIEREMALEGMWLQPDGRLAILDGENFKRLTPDEAIRYLREAALKAVREEVQEEHRGKDDLAMRRARRLSRRARHRLFLAFELLHARTRVADLYPSGVAGPWSNLDIPMFERVFEYKEGDDWLQDREKAISKLPRYNPQYDMYGFYYKWIEPRNLAYSWEKRFEEGSYPMRNVLNINR